MEQLIQSGEVGKGIADFGFLIMAAAAYLVYSSALIILFIKWFVRIINRIIDRQQQLLDEILAMEKHQNELLEDMNRKIKLST
jgi:hypothetical protein